MAESSQPGDVVADVPSSASQESQDVTLKEHQGESAAFPFRNLPYDVRHMIYKTHLISSRGLVRLARRSEPFFGKVKPARLGINLLLTCKEVYNEGINVLYGCNTFSLLPALMINDKPEEEQAECGCDFSMCRDHTDHNRATKLLEQMGMENRSKIRTVEIMMLTPSMICLSHILPMSTWLPNLDSQIRFFDLNSNIGELELSDKGFAGFCAALAAYLPVTKNTTYDFSPWLDELLLQVLGWPLDVNVRSAVNTIESLHSDQVTQSEGVHCKKAVTEMRVFAVHETLVDEVLYAVTGEKYWESGGIMTYKDHLDLRGDSTDDESEAEMEDASWNLVNATCQKWMSFDPDGLNALLEEPFSQGAASENKSTTHRASTDSTAGDPTA